MSQRVQVVPIGTYTRSRQMTPIKRVKEPNPIYYFYFTLQAIKPGPNNRAKFIKFIGGGKTPAEQYQLNLYSVAVKDDRINKSTVPIIAISYKYGNFDSIDLEYQASLQKFNIAPLLITHLLSIGTANIVHDIFREAADLKIQYPNLENINDVSLMYKLFKSYGRWLSQHMPDQQNLLRRVMLFTVCSELAPELVDCIAFNTFVYSGDAVYIPLVDKLTVDITRASDRDMDEMFARVDAAAHMLVPTATARNTLAQHLDSVMGKMRLAYQNNSSTTELQSRYTQILHETGMYDSLLEKQFHLLESLNYSTMLEIAKITQPTTPTLTPAMFISMMLFLYVYVRFDRLLLAKATEKLHCFDVTCELDPYNESCIEFQISKIYSETTGWFFNMQCEYTIRGGLEGSADDWNLPANQLENKYQLLSRLHTMIDQIKEVQSLSVERIKAKMELQKIKLYTLDAFPP